MNADLLQLPDNPRQWRDFYRRHLLEFVMPFWMRHAVDEEHGGLLACLNDSGRVLCTDKYLWSQTRALWTFSALYRRIEPRAEWLEVAHSLYRFCVRHGRDESGQWRFRTARDGTPIDGPLSIVTDCFAIYGLIEYARITGEDEAVRIAVETYQSVDERIRSGRPFGTAPYPLPDGMKAHRYAMQCSLMFHELGMYLKDGAILDSSEYYTKQILAEFVRPEHEVLVEYVDLDGSFSDTPPGRAMVPGHGIESLWFQLQIFRERSTPERVPEVLRALKWRFQRGWDEEYGGLFLGLDIFGQEPPFWKHADCKIWWPATEALCATLLAHELEPDGGWLHEHRRVMDWALKHFPVPEHGEWYNRLNRQGQPLDEVVALPVKDPFHLPRGLIVAIEALERMEQSDKTENHGQHLLG